MRKIKVSEASGPALDWLVAKCEGRAELKRYLTDEEKEAQDIPYFMDVYEVFCPSTNWSQGGPIIEREKIGTEARDEKHGDWVAGTFDAGTYKIGETPLTAAMRCYVASKLGEEVEVPEELP